MTDGWPTYDGERLRHFAMPLGGIGTGTVALAGTGGLRQWQLHNTGNHLGSIPDSFFAIRVSQWEPPFDELRLLQAPGLQPTNTPLVNDDAVPPGEARLHEVFTPMRSASVEAVYPVARTTYDTGLPLGVQLEAFNPLVPLDADDSARPVAALTFTLTNDGEQELHGWLGGALQNAVGWDGVTPIEGVACPLYGGNTNHVRRWDGWTAAVLENHTLPAEHPGAGQLVLATDGAGAQVLPQWTRPEQFKEFLSARPATVQRFRSRAECRRHDLERRSRRAVPAGSGGGGDDPVPARLAVPEPVRRLRPVRAEARLRAQPVLARQRLQLGAAGRGGAGRGGGRYLGRPAGGDAALGGGVRVQHTAR